MHLLAGARSHEPCVRLVSVSVAVAPCCLSQTASELFTSPLPDSQHPTEPEDPLSSILTPDSLTRLRYLAPVVCRFSVRGCRFALPVSGCSVVSPALICIRLCIKTARVWRQ
eukprot:868017-Rhodomonas_salina.1